MSTQQPPRKRSSSLPWRPRLLRAAAIAACLVSGVCAQPAQAQVLRLDDKSAAPPVEAEPTSVKLAISPAAEPSPALRYRFWVSDVRRRDGNAITNMLRANALVREVVNRQQVENQWNEKWNSNEEDQSIDKFPKADAQIYLNSYQSVLKELAEMDNASYIDYELRWKDLRGPEVISILFPEIQQARNLSRLVATQARLATAEGRFEDAIASIRVGIRLSEVVSHMGRSFMIGKLVGLSICSDMLGEIEVLIQQPGAPNLYWAIASWPHELDNLESALEGEMVAMEKMFSRVTELPTEEITAGAWQARVIETTSDFLRMTDNTGYSDPEAHQRAAALWAGCAVLLFGDQAKDELRTASQSDSADTSYAEALIRNTRRDLLKLQSDFFKWSLLTDGTDERQSSTTFFDVLTKDMVRPAHMILGYVLPATASMRDYHRRVINNRNRLITIESLRAYAAVHQALPESLPVRNDQQRTLPAWKNGYSGQPFEYSRTSPTQATLKYDSPWPVDVRGTTVITLRK